jgi:phage repressor protein C with HTH and peptisase S24 domain
MLTYVDIWRAIDRLAHAHGLTPSGLARRSKLDPTTFNKSKRVSRDGKYRWPSTESIAKILAATGADLAEFATYAGAAPPPGADRRVPMMSIAQAVLF